MYSDLNITSEQLRKIKHQCDCNELVENHYNDFDDNKKEELIHCLNMLYCQSCSFQNNLCSLEDFRNILSECKINEKFRDCLTAINCFDTISFSDLVSIADINNWSNRNKFNEDNYNSGVMINIGTSSHLVFYLKDGNFYVDARDNDLEIDTSRVINFELSFTDNISLVLAQIGIYKIFYTDSEKNQLQSVLNNFKIDNRFNNINALCIA